MKLENQVCSLELAKKLKELGVKQESLWWWATLQKTTGIYPVKQSNASNYSAFTVAELGEILRHGMTKSMAMAKGGWRCDYELVSTKRDRWIIQEATTEANARAKMKIWLIEQEKV